MLQLALLAATVAAIFLCGAHAIAAPFPTRTIVVKPAPALTKGAYGWQPVATIFLGASQTAILTTTSMLCPDNHPRAVSGEYRMSAYQPMSLLRNASGNLDTPSNSARWVFNFYFPSSPVAATISYSVYCADKEEPEPISAAQPRQ